jgi:hypothetical protein
MATMPAAVRFTAALKAIVYFSENEGTGFPIAEPDTRPDCPHDGLFPRQKTDPIWSPGLCRKDFLFAQGAALGNLSDTT